MEPRTSMERHLMDRDREGQLYLEARRQRAVHELLENRTSFLSTITPPSTNPSSIASSLFHEALDGPSRTETTAAAESLSTLPLPLPLSSTAIIHASTQPSTLSIPTNVPATNVSSTYRKTRSQSVSGRGRKHIPTADDTIVVPISPSSLEYQLTAHLLNYNHRLETPSTVGAEARARSKSRTRPQQHRRRRDTINKETRIDSRNPTNKGAGRGHWYSQSSDKNLHKANVDEVDNGVNSSCHMTICADTAAATPTTITLEELTPTSLLGSTPSSPTDIQALPASISPCTEQQPLPKNTSIPLPTIPPSPPLPPLPPKSPRSLIAHYFPRSLQPPPPRHRTNFYPKGPSVAPAPYETPTFGPVLLATSDHTQNPLPSTSSSFSCIPAADLSRSSTIITNDLPEPEPVPIRVQPSPSIVAHGNLVSTDRAQVSVNCLNTRQSQAVRQRPEIMVSTPPSEPSSSNTSRDLEMVIKEITGQLQACRSALDPLPSTTSAWDEKPLPRVCREKGARYWVFRDQDGIVIGPYFFLLGHLCPVLWWIGSVYPRTMHPDSLSTIELGKAVEITPQEDMLDHSLSPWLQQPQSKATALFEQQLQYDRKVLRSELDQRWRRMNLIWSLGSFLLAIIVIAFVIGRA